MKKILIVEDDQFFREALRDVLKKKYTVLEAPNGKSAKEILLMQDFDAVLSDIQMPAFTGLELLEWSRKNCPVPFIIMTGFSAVLETTTAFELGAKGFIAKPFKNAELISVIEQVLGEDAGKKFPLTDVTQEYCKVSIDEFVSRPKIDFDVFIKLSETKIIKIAHQGQDIPKEKVAYYKDKGVKHLYLLKEEFGKIVDFNMGLAKIIHSRSDISAEKKMNFMKYTGELILEKTFVDGLDKNSLYEAKSFLELTLTTVTDSTASLDVLSILSTHSDHVYAHSLGVSLYSVMIARLLGFESSIVLFKLSMAGLFHDIGKKEIDREILDKPRHLVSKEERKLIESHVARGQAILSTMPGISSDVLQLVGEHHEDMEGQGYPLGKEKFKLHPLSKILQCANIFLDATVTGACGPSRTALAAIDHIEILYGNRIDLQCLAALKVLFKPMPNPT